MKCGSGGGAAGQHDRCREERAVVVERPGFLTGQERRHTAVQPPECQPQPDGPLCVRGNLEIVSGTGRAVARVDSARLCRCGGSQSKPFCDGTHSKIGFQGAELAVKKAEEGS